MKEQTLEFRALVVELLGRWNNTSYVGKTRLLVGTEKLFKGIFRSVLLLERLLLINRNFYP